MDYFNPHFTFISAICSWFDIYVYVNKLLVYIYISQMIRRCSLEILRAEEVKMAADIAYCRI